MVILLPDEGEFETLEGSLDAGQVDGILKNLTYEQVALTMPRFEIESGVDLGGALAAMGMPDAFSLAADFSGMDGTRELFIREVVHKAFVSVDEAGTEATAATAVEKFLFINQNLRRADYDQIRQICKTSESQLLWKGTFQRLPRSAPRAGYADHRTYKYNGHVIDNQFHLGVDLASVERSPVPTANHGVVVFADRMGIYGRTVFIDHGFGLFSMYAHLNTISVKVGQKLKKGDIIGRTGSTGLAGGDHLHFGMLIQHTFVNPIEWWDAAWIKNNIASKIDRVKSRLE